MTEKLKIAIIGAIGVVLAAAIAAIATLSKGEPTSKDSKPGISVSGSDRTAIVQGAGTVTIDQSTTKSTDSLVRVVDVSAKQTKLDVATVDLKLRNAGDTSAFMKQLELHVIDSVVLEQCSRCPGEPVFPSAQYDMALPNLKPKTISQAISPRGVDRFEVAVQANHFSSFAVYKAQMRIVYDEDNKSVTTDAFMLTFGPLNWSLPFSDDAGCTTKAFLSACTTKNRELLRKIGYSR